MILSKNQELGEYDRIQTPEHIAQVWAAIETALPGYWARFVKRESAKGTAGAGAVMPSFSAAVKKYEKAAQKYRTFFDPEAMDEYQDDPNSFKQNLAKDVPVIAGTLNQRRRELQEWQRHFRGAKGRDLLGVFSTLLDFKDDWLAKHGESKYAQYDTIEALGLQPFEDDSMTLTNVIGGGIKSIVLFNLSPDRLPPRTRSDLYGLYFLSDMQPFGLPSDSSEFLMINDREPTSNGSFIMEHNFWYPYGLYSLYALRIFRWIDEQLQGSGIRLDPHVRYVYITHFLNEVCSEKVEHMKVMRAFDRFEIPA